MVTVAAPPVTAFTTLFNLSKKPMVCLSRGVNSSTVNVLQLSDSKRENASSREMRPYILNSSSGMPAVSVPPEHDIKSVFSCYQTEFLIIDPVSGSLMGDLSDMAQAGGRFVLHRFNGDEVFRIHKAEMFAYKSDNGVTLWFE